MKVTLQFTLLALLLNLIPSHALILKTIKDDVVIQAANDNEYYVSARSGLNYRDRPKGEVLGKFALNTKVKVIENTKIFEQIVDGKNTVDGEWVGVEKDMDTVYVFSAYLSPTQTESDLKVYFTSPYYNYENDIRQGFINISDSYYNILAAQSTNILYESDLGKDTIHLDKKQRSRLLRKLDISEDDTAFIYNFPLDSVIAYKIKNLPVIAAVNIYASGDEDSESQYEFGFNLGKSYSHKGDNFTVIGNENPFQTGKVRTMIWQPIKVEKFPIKFDINILQENIREWFDNVIIGENYMFKYDNFRYYIQNLEVKGNTMARYLVVIDAKTNKTIFKDVFVDSESTYLVPLHTNSGTPAWGTQWAGKVFKNQSSILYGFLGATFGCEEIHFLSATEPPIFILCDNRH